MATNTDFKNITKMYSDLYADWTLHKPLWDDIARFVQISVDTDYLWNTNKSNYGDQLDEFVDDPTAAICVNQFGDYMLGIMWGTGEKVFDMVPSDYVLEMATPDELNEWYEYATSRTLYHMNHPSAGYTQALRPYIYDQGGFGTSGIGIWPNKAFLRGVDENALIARMYGIDNSVIAEGKAGLVDTGFVLERWKCNRIVQEFCMPNGTVDKKLFGKLPNAIKTAYEKQDLSQEFELLFGFMPREDFNPKLQGKLGTRYRGVWWQKGQPDGDFFCEESYAERPIAFSRLIKIRGDAYGRAGGTLLLSSIRSRNFMFGATMEILEKLGDPPLGVTSNALFGDSILDTSPRGLTVFNAMLAAGGNPTFPIHDVGDPTGIISYLMPVTKEDITTGFKVDALLDFSSAKDMTATESLQRYAIRGKSLSGMLGQQKNERLVPDAKRAISILWDMGELGADPSIDKERVARLVQAQKTERVIPAAVLKAKALGKPWFELKFNNELEKLTRTEAVQNLLQILNSITAIAALYPDIVDAVNWYQLLADINDNLDYGNQILMSETKFKGMIADKAKQRAAAQSIQAAGGVAAAQKAQGEGARANAQATATQQSVAAQPGAAPNGA